MILNPKVLDQIIEHLWANNLTIILFLKLQV